MASRRFVQLVKESSPGTPKASPVLNTDYFVIRQTQPITMQAVPTIEDIMYGGGLVVPACAYSDQETCQGTLSTLLYPSQALPLLQWGLTRINSGRTTPWVTTDAGDANSEAGVMPPGDLASMSLYEAVKENDGTYTRKRYSYCKVVSGSLTGSATARAWTLNLNIIGMRDDTNAAGEVAAPDTDEFPDPAETDYPCGPFVFSDIAGGLKIGSSRTTFDSVNFEWTNTLKGQWFEQKYPLLINWFGRTSRLTCGLYRKKTPDDLASLKALTVQDAEFTLSRSAKTVKVDFNGQNRWKQLTAQYPDDSAYSWQGQLQNYWDPTLATDVTVTGT